MGLVNLSFADDVGNAVAGNGVKTAHGRRLFVYAHIHVHVLRLLTSAEARLVLVNIDQSELRTQFCGLARSGSRSRQASFAHPARAPRYGWLVVASGLGDALQVQGLDTTRSAA